MPHLAIRAPSRPLVGTPPLVGDKSISHRALILGALADGPTTIINLSPCADVARTRACLTALGVRIDPAGEAGGEGDGGGDSGASDHAGTVVVHGRGVSGLAGPPAELDCGDSGTTLRLLAGVLAGQDRAFTLDGAPGLRRRPMARVVEPLVAMGADLRSTAGRAPLHGRGGPLNAIDVALAHASAQVGGAVLLAGIRAAGETRVRYPAPVRDHTERMLAAMGAPIRWDGVVSALSGPVERLAPVGGAADPRDTAAPGDPRDSAPAGRLVVPDDPSAAAFLLAAAAIVPGSRIALLRVGVNPGRTGFLDILAAMGARVDLDDRATHASEPVATVHLAAAPLVATEVAGPLVPRAIDELPLVAVVATQARGRTVVRGAAELRVKECDRIAAIVEGLARMGARIEARPDGFEVEGPTALRPPADALDGHDDHRIVMALAVAGLAAEGETVVSGAVRVGDSFPGFAGALRAVGAKVRVVGLSEKLG